MGKIGTSKRSSTKTTEDLFAIFQPMSGRLARGLESELMQLTACLAAPWPALGACTAIP